MHNILSRNQLDEWRNFESTVEECDSEMQKLNENMIVKILSAKRYPEGFGRGS